MYDQLNPTETQNKNLKMETLVAEIKAADRIHISVETALHRLPHLSSTKSRHSHSYAERNSIRLPQ